MKNFDSYQISFQGRPTKLVKADKVLRLLNSYCPSASNTRYYKFNTTKKNTTMQQSVAMLGLEFLLMRKNLHRSEVNDTPKDYCQYLLKTIKNSASLTVAN